METIRIEIGKTISTILKDIGIQSYPDKHAQKRIMYYLLNYYKDFSLKEIRQAFEMALTGKIKVNAEHYQSFDMRYIARILNAFRDFRRLQKLAYSTNTVSLKALHASPEISPKAKNIAYLSRLARTLNRVQSIEKLHLIHTVAYNKLIEEGILQVSEQTWLELMAKAEQQYLAKLRKSRSFEDKHILKNFEQLKHQYPLVLTRLQLIAKKIAVIKFLHKLKSTGTDLNALLNPLKS